jgi:hypothetical protein
MTRYAAILGILALAACGANGEPEQPGNGPKVTGDARVGVSVSQSGVRPSAAVSLGQGPVRLTVGF